ncbi:MAG TPA: BRO family protein [Desulfosporosinus sp.]
MVNEPWLYALIGLSHKPEAKNFQQWVNHNVLLSIEETGDYSIQP